MIVHNCKHFTNWSFYSPVLTHSVANRSISCLWDHHSSCYSIKMLIAHHTWCSCAGMGRFLDSCAAFTRNICPLHLPRMKQPRVQFSNVNMLQEGGIVGWDVGLGVLWVAKGPSRKNWLKNKQTRPWWCVVCLVSVFGECVWAAL